MKTPCKAILISFLILLSLVSCVSSRKLSYLQYTVDLTNAHVLTTFTPAAYRMMPYDIIYINVVTPDPQWSSIFNPSATAAGTSMTQESAALMGYTIDENGKIDLPFVGSLKVAGKTLSEIKIDLDSTLKHYVTDASITVKLVNNYISIIGEVSAPGRYPMTKYRLNVFEALSMAADLNLYGDRQKVQLIRQSPYGPVIKEFSLKDRSILTSDYYYIMPNDIIYVRPMKARSFQINSSTYSLILSSIATILSSVTTILVLFGYGR
ncbi:MAG: polysaccharide biosynthesis/export family protein [Bacteroidales bacterium]